jgi:hypothetical protein
MTGFVVGEVLHVLQLNIQRDFHQNLPKYAQSLANESLEHVKRRMNMTKTEGHVKRKKVSLDDCGLRMAEKPRE